MVRGTAEHASRARQPDAAPPHSDVQDSEKTAMSLTSLSYALFLTDLIAYWEP